jgi:hypothetical protein
MSGTTTRVHHHAVGERDLTSTRGLRRILPRDDLAERGNRQHLAQRTILLRPFTNTSMLSPVFANPAQRS